MRKTHHRHEYARPSKQYHHGKAQILRRRESGEYVQEVARTQRQYRSHSPGGDGKEGHVPQSRSDLQRQGRRRELQQGDRQHARKFVRREHDLVREYDPDRGHGVEERRAYPLTPGGVVVGGIRRRR